MLDNRSGDVRREAVMAELGPFLARKSTPKGFGADAIKAETRVMVDAVLADLPRDASAARDTLAQALHRLDMAARHRGWPTAGELRDAVKSGRGEDAPGEVSVDVRADRAERWWRRFRDLGCWSQDGGVIEELLRRGVATAQEFWDGGVGVPEHLRDWPGAKVRDGVIVKRFGPDSIDRLRRR